MKKSKKIVVCFPSVPFVRGGAENLKDGLVEALRLAGHKVEEVILPFSWHPKRQILKSCHAWRMLDLLDSYAEDIDLVITTKFPSYVIKHPKKVVWLVHQMREVYDLQGTEFDDFQTDEAKYVRDCIHRIDQKTLAEAKKIFAISRNVAGRLEKYNGLQAECLYPPVRNKDMFYARDFGDYLLYSGRIDAKKRVDVCIEAMKNMNKSITLKITGKMDNDYGEKLKNLVEKEGLEDRVEFLGFVTDAELAKLYADCLAVFYPPLDEDYGYVTIEAFLSQKPIITAKDSGGTLEFVVDDENGVVFEVKDLKNLGGRVNDLFMDKDKARRLGERGYAKVKDISWSHVINKLLA